MVERKDEQSPRTRSELPTCSRRRSDHPSSDPIPSNRRSISFMSLDHTHLLRPFPPHADGNGGHGSNQPPQSLPRPRFEVNETIADRSIMTSTTTAADPCE